LTIPAFLFGVVAGPMVDLNSKKKVMLITNGILIGLFLLYFFTREQTFPILILAFLTASVARFFIPAEAAAIPMLVKEHELEQANSAFLLTLLGSVLIGYSIAGPIIQFFGGLGTAGQYAPFIISSISVIVGFFLCFFLKKIDKAPLRIPKGRGILNATVTLFWETVQEVANQKRVSLSLLLLIFVELNVGILSVVLLEYVRQYLLLPLTFITYYLIFPLVFGLFLGMIFLRTIERRLGIRRSVALACACIGVLFFLLGAVPSVISEIHILRFFAVVSSMLTGVCIVMIAVQSRTILQTSTPITMQGRIFSFLDVMVAMVTPLPVLLLGFFATRVNLLTTFILLGIVIFVITMIGNFLYRK
jgi:MFS family permease